MSNLEYISLTVSRKGKLLLSEKLHTICYFRPKEKQNEIRTSVEDINLEKIAQEAQSDSDSIDDDADDTFLPTGSSIVFPILLVS